MSGLPVEATRAAVIRELPLDDSNGRFTVPDVTILRRMGYPLDHIPVYAPAARQRAGLLAITYAPATRWRALRETSNHARSKGS